MQPASMQTTTRGCSSDAPVSGLPSTIFPNNKLLHLKVVHFIIEKWNNTNLVK
jgi:hypothetical protein